MPNEMTAALYLSPLDARTMLPSELMILCENFRPGWTGQSLLLSGAPALAPVHVTAGTPRHQLAQGLLAHLWMTKPALLAADPQLAGLLTTGPRGLTTIPLSGKDAHRVYAAAAPLVRADLSLHRGTCITDRDITHARRCGLRLTVADARSRRVEKRAS